MGESWWVGIASLCEGTLHDATTAAAIGDHRDPVQREEDSHQLVGPAGRAVVEAGNDTPDSKGDRQSGQAGSPPGQLGALAGEVRAAGRVGDLG